MRFLEVLGEVRLLGGDEVAELAVELLSQGLGVVPGDVVGQSVLGHRSVETLLALVLKEGKLVFTISNLKTSLEQIYRWPYNIFSKRPLHAS